MSKSNKNHSHESGVNNPSAASPAATVPIEHVGRKLMQQKKLRQKLGDVSQMWLFRHKDELPAPILIAGRRFWQEEEIDAFIERLSTKRNLEESQRSGDSS